MRARVEERKNAGTYKRARPRTPQQEAARVRRWGSSEGMRKSPSLEPAARRRLRLVACGGPGTKLRAGCTFTGQVLMQGKDHCTRVYSPPNFALNQALIRAASFQCGQSSWKGSIALVVEWLNAMASSTLSEELTVGVELIEGGFGPSELSTAR